MPLLVGDAVRRLVCESIDRAMSTQQFRLAAFVLMPDHVHLLVYPVTPDPRIDRLLLAIKRPASFRIKRLLQDRQSPLLKQRTIRERPGKSAFRFWQEGGGYDRNLSQVTTTLSAIDYIHMNPVRRGLVPQSRHWKWSSARWYESDGRFVDPDLPTVHGLPWDFFEHVTS